MPTPLKIPQGQTREEVKQRRKIIRDFYATWNAANPTKQVYNTNLKEFINVRYLSINETAEMASRRYISTFAITHFLLKFWNLQKKYGEQNLNRITIIKNVFLKLLRWNTAKKNLEQLNSQ